MTFQLARQVLLCSVFWGGLSPVGCGPVCVAAADPDTGKPSQNQSIPGQSTQNKPPQKLGPVEIRTLLEQGSTAATWPDGLVIRVAACLGEPKEKVEDQGLPNGVVEMWEFTAKEVRRVVPQELTSSKPRVWEAVPCDTQVTCKSLLDGKAIDIHSENGQGPEIGFVGSKYERGSRSIEIDLNGETVLNLFETNGPFLKFYKESDAQAFGALYEKLSAQAKSAFEAQSDGGPDKPLK